MTAHQDARRSADRRNELLVVLMGALEVQEFVIAAFIPIGILAAHVWPRLVHRALALFSVEEPAHRFINRVLMMSQELLVDFCRLVVKCELLAGRRRGYSRMLGEPLDVVVRYRNASVTTAIPGAFFAIEFHAL